MSNNQLALEVEKIREEYLNKWITGNLKRPIHTLTKELIEDLGWFLSIEHPSYTKTVYRLVNPKKQLSHLMALNISVGQVCPRGIAYYQHINVSVSYL